MSLYEIKKVENCISKSSIYQYRFNFKLTEEFIKKIGNADEIKFHRNFPKPSFNITFPDGTKIIGVLHDVAFKVMFPLEAEEDCKNRLEIILTEITCNLEQRG